MAGNSLGPEARELKARRSFEDNGENDFQRQGPFQYRATGEAGPEGAHGGPGPWLLREAKAHLSELVRRVRSEGPQHATVHGKDEVVVIAAEEFRRLTGEQTGSALIEAMQASPYRELGLEPPRGRMPVRDIDLM